MSRMCEFVPSKARVDLRHVLNDKTHVLHIPQSGRVLLCELLRERGALWTRLAAFSAHVCVVEDAFVEAKMPQVRGYRGIPPAVFVSRKNCVFAGRRESS